MNWEYYKQYIKSKNTKGRCDITPIFENPKAFNNLIKDMDKLTNKNKFNKIIAIDALGFILGSALAYKTKKPLVLIRKEGKLPYPSNFLAYDQFIDYTKTKKGFEIKKDSINPNDKILIVDEWIETGTQAKSAIKLIEKLKGKVTGIFSINLDLNKNTQILLNKYNCKAIHISNNLK